MTINIDAMLATPGSLTKGRTYKQVLIDARAHISTPDRWTQEAYARDAQGNHTRPRDPKACCWCMLGAVAYVSNDVGIIPPPLMTFLADMVPYHFGPGRFTGPGSMNDFVSHQLVLQFLDNAIAQFPQEAP
jgi:hypothetical protein